MIMDEDIWEKEAARLIFPDKKTDRKKDEGKWITHACFFACGGRCVNRSFVKSGYAYRQKTDDLHLDSPDFPQQRGCARGRSLRQMIFGVDRLKYPLKRKHWKPGGGDRSLRGCDEWVRISWEEALDLVAQETTRIKETYGNRSILTTGYEQRNVIPGLYYGTALNAYGGCVTTWGQASQGGFPVVAKQMKGEWSLGRMDTSDRFEVRNAKLILLWAINSAWSQGGNVTWHYAQAKKAGAKIIVVDTWYTPTAQALADEWIPVRPGTDTALLMALAYEMIINDWQDQEFLNKYCVGFDREHMPEGSDLRENFRDYVLGSYDHISKTAEWASEICGTPVEKIRYLAREMSHTKPMTMKCSFAPARTYEGGRFAQAYFTVGWMTGNVGISGAEVSVGASAGNLIFGGPPLVYPGSKGFTPPVNPICEPPRGGGKLGAGEYDPNKYYGIAMGEMWDAILTGEHTHFRDGRVPIDIRMIWKVGDGGRMNQSPDFNKAVQAYRKVEFAVASDLQMTSDCLYSDIVLPATSLWERWGMVVPQTNRELLIFSSQVTEPMFECRDDLWIEAELCKRWGLDPAIVKPLSDKQIAYNELSGAKVIREDGKGYETLLTFTENDIKELGVDGSPQEGKIQWQEFRKTGVYQVKRHPDDGLGYVEYEDFIRDPEEHPIGTTSGKFEIACPSLVKCYEDFGLTPIDLVAKYVPSVDGYESTFINWKTKKKGDYPFQLISIHHVRRAHQAFDNIEALRELFPGEVLMNDRDAKQLGIQSEDTILISNPYGKILRRVSPSALVMPGILLLGQGAWTRFNEQGIDIGGNANVLSPGRLCGEGQSPWNTVTVAVEKWKGAPLEADYLWKQRIVNAEE